MKCPACLRGNIPMIKVWFFVPYFRITCKDCDAKLRVRKSGVGKFSSFILGVPLGLLVGCGFTGVFWRLDLFLVATAIIFLTDFLIDVRYAKLFEAQ